MSVEANLRDLVDRFVPSWLSDRYPESPSYGFRFLWAMVLVLDGSIEAISQASLGAVGRSGQALEQIGAARGLLRNQDESDDDYGARLATWIDRAKENGSVYRLALAIHDYLRSHPRVRVFRRDGWCLTVDTDRSQTVTEETAWDWDSVSHPERNDEDAPWWSDLFVVVYTTSGSSEQWPVRAGTLGGMGADDRLALGHGATWKERDDIKSLIQTCKSCHSCVRALIWCSDEEQFDPDDDDTMPDGTWGAWGIADGSAYVPSGRDTETCRFWEPR